MAAARVQSVDRVFQLLEHLADSVEPLTISDLTERADLPMATIHRLLQTLANQGYIRQGPSKRYALGPRMIRLGDAASQHLGAWAKPLLTRAVEEFGETTNMAVLDGDACVYVEQVAPPRTMRMFTEVGRVVPVHSTGVGKAMLSTLADERLAAMLGRAGLARITENTITTVPRMLEVLAEIRDQGYAVDDGEQELGVRCVAVPITGLPFPAALSVSGPSSRVLPDDPARIGPSLQDYAAELTAAFGLTKFDD